MKRSSSKQLEAGNPGHSSSKGPPRKNAYLKTRNKKTGPQKKRRRLKATFQDPNASNSSKAKGGGSRTEKPNPKVPKGAILIRASKGSVDFWQQIRMGVFKFNRMKNIVKFLKDFGEFNQFPIYIYNSTSFEIAGPYTSNPPSNYDQRHDSRYNKETVVLDHDDGCVRLLHIDRYIPGDLGATSSKQMAKVQDYDSRPRIIQLDKDGKHKQLVTCLEDYIFVSKIDKSTRRPQKRSSTIVNHDGTIHEKFVVDGLPTSPINVIQSIKTVLETRSKKECRMSLYRESCKPVYEAPLYVEYYRYQMVQGRDNKSGQPLEWTLFNKLEKYFNEQNIPNNRAEISKLFNQWVFAYETPKNHDDPVIPCYEPLEPDYLVDLLWVMIKTVKNKTNYSETKREFPMQRMQPIVNHVIALCVKFSEIVNTVLRLHPIQAGQWTDDSTGLEVDFSLYNPSRRKGKEGGVIFKMAENVCTFEFTIRSTLYKKLKLAYENTTNTTFKNKLITKYSKQKMQQLLDLRHNRMHTRILAMYLRYETLIATNKAAGMQGSVPHGAFKVLNEDCGVHGECFASPLNQTLLYLETEKNTSTKNGSSSSSSSSRSTKSTTSNRSPRYTNNLPASFCSAFRDTDHWFGSKGSFFSSSFQEYVIKNGGNYEANPPFGKNEMCFEIMLQQMMNALIAASLPIENKERDGLLKNRIIPPRPLSFCIISPTNNFDSSPAVTRMRNQKYNIQISLHKKQGSKTSFKSFKTNSHQAKNDIKSIAKNGLLSNGRIIAPWLENKNGFSKNSSTSTTPRDGSNRSNSNNRNNSNNSNNGNSRSNSSNGSNGLKGPRKKMKQINEPQKSSGDWPCYACGGNNYSRRTYCYRCEADRGYKPPSRKAPPPGPPPGMQRSSSSSTSSTSSSSTSSTSSSSSSSSTPIHYLDDQTIPNFLSCEITYNEGEHYYVQGQRNDLNKTALWKATTDSCFMWLQNDAAVQKWPVEKNTINKLGLAFKHRENEALPDWMENKSSSSSSSLASLASVASLASLASSTSSLGKRSGRNSPEESDEDDSSSSGEDMTLADLNNGRSKKKIKKKKPKKLKKKKKVKRSKKKRKQRVVETISSSEDEDVEMEEEEEEEEMEEEEEEEVNAFFPKKEKDILMSSTGLGLVGICYAKKFPKWGNYDGVIVQYLPELEHIPNTRLSGKAYVGRYLSGYDEEYEDDDYFSLTELQEIIQQDRRGTKGTGLKYVWVPGNTDQTHVNIWEKGTIAIKIGLKEISFTEESPRAMRAIKKWRKANPDQAKQVDQEKAKIKATKMEKKSIGNKVSNKVAPEVIVIDEEEEKKSSSSSSSLLVSSLPVSSSSSSSSSSISNAVVMDEDDVVMVPIAADVNKKKDTNQKKVITEENNDDNDDNDEVMEMNDEDGDSSDMSEWDSSDEDHAEILL